MGLRERTEAAGRLPQWADVIDALAQRRYELGMSGHQLAARIGVDADLVLKWEAGIKNPTGYLLWCWAKALDMDFALATQDGAYELRPAWLQQTRAERGKRVPALQAACG